MLVKAFSSSFVLKLVAYPQKPLIPHGLSSVGKETGIVGLIGIVGIWIEGAGLTVIIGLIVRGWITIFDGMISAEAIESNRTTTIKNDLCIKEGIKILNKG